MSKRDIKDFICRPFCKFFREGEKEDMECRGAIVIERLIKTTLNPENFPTQGKKPSLWEKRPLLLFEKICRKCEFLKDGCDFQSSEPPEEAEPCGGYILISLLLEKKLLNSANLEEAAIE